ncbi:AMP-binding protein [Lipingzhangella sp. LS1_29]|uniref:AMP-binding protein n=2 Tax=Lipingzhangella rawalii TaxID=2055835 RepID=A0ABU2HB36_9ACTN|nr:AMP-binding protein [Lipingzhangella rawalii]
MDQCPSATPSAGPHSSMLGGLLDQLHSLRDRPTVVDPYTGWITATQLAGWIRDGARGLVSRGLLPEDTVGVLAPPGSERLVGKLAILTAGGIALPMELRTDPELLVRALLETDTRMMLAGTGTGGSALALAERSRVRQVIAFESDVPGTTALSDVLLCAPHPGEYDPDHVLFDNGIRIHPTVVSSSPSSEAMPPRTSSWLYRNPELTELVNHIDRTLRITGEDVVAVSTAVPEPERTALSVLALRRGARVLLASTTSGDDLEKFQHRDRATVRDLARVS